MTAIDPVIQNLMTKGHDAWERLRAQPGGKYCNLIPSDQQAAYDTLRDLRTKRHQRFLELGSGVGVISIMADLLGYETYGIEIEPELIDISEELARECKSGATFVEGSFVPNDYQNDVEFMAAGFLTVTDGADAYDEIGFDLADFDVVYAYSWPDEQEWLLELARRYVGPETTFVNYSHRDGMMVNRPGTL